MLLSGSQGKQKNPRPTKEGETATRFGWVRLLLRMNSYDGCNSNNHEYEACPAGGRNVRAKNYFGPFERKCF